MSNWIKCSERMPGTDGSFMTWNGKYVSMSPYFFGGWQVNHFLAKNITHWQPLPSPPED